MNQETKRTLAHLFGRNKKALFVYQTSDGQYFSEKHFAEAHAAELKNKEIETFTRRDLKDSPVETPVVDTAKQPEKNAPASKSTKSQTSKSK